MPTTTTTTKTTISGSTPTGYIGLTHYRFNAWVALMVLSLVALISIVAVTDGNQKRNFEERWSLALTAISMIIGFFACVGHGVFVFRQKFIASLVELLMALICVFCWIFCLPMITTPDDGLAVDHNFQIDDANLYFASWGAFIFACLLLASVASERGIDGSRDGFARRWLWLVISSIVVMAASSRLFDATCQNRQFRAEAEYCKELKLGISMGVISALFAGFMYLLMWTSPERAPLAAVGAFFALLACVIWGVTVAYLTFDNGPATKVGNLFFGIWVSAILALDLGVCYLMAFLS